MAISLREIRNRFAELLAGSPSEAELQTFFRNHPEVLSASLPLKLSAQSIIARGRPGRSEADFVFYEVAREQPIYGVIELKRPDTRILSLPRRNILTLSRDAQTALAQAQVYASQLQRPVGTHASHMVSIGNEAYCFVILGLSSEIARALQAELAEEQIRRLLPPGVQLIPYDTLFREFSRRVPPEIFFLVPIASNPPPCITVERDQIVVDYSGKAGSTAGHSRTASLAGVVESGMTLTLRTIGACPYCNQFHSGNTVNDSHSHTPAGAIEYFFTATENQVSFRKLRCPAIGEGGVYREDYNAEQVQVWFKDLRGGHCRRCGSHSVEQLDWNDGVAFVERSTCRRCSFREERHVWRPPSWGA